MSRGILERSAGSAPWTLTYDDERVPCAPGETVVDALLAHGALATTRSLKYRRHRGAYCLSGDCGTCLARVDGEPNVRTCLTPVHDGQDVRSQNRIAPVGPDPTGLADKVFSKGFDHHHLMVRPRALNRIMKEVARNLAGLGTLPDRIDGASAEHHHDTPDVLVIGGGWAGRAVADEVRAAGHRCVVVERAPSDPPHPSDERDERDELRGTGVFAVYPTEHCIAATQIRARLGDRAFTFCPRHVVFATGGRDSMIPLQNNDLPGIVSAQGLLRATVRTGMPVRGPAVVVGDGTSAEALAAALGARRLPPADIREFDGRSNVDRVILRDGTKLNVSVVALAPVPSPASELARQGGAQVRWNGVGFEVVREPDGRVQTTGPWIAWAAGNVAGFMGERARDDGRAVGAAICERLGASS